MKKLFLFCALAALVLPLRVAAHDHANAEFLAFLASIDDGKGPISGPLPTPPMATTDGTVPLASYCLGITEELQRKDTQMLCLDTCNETGAMCWDDEQANHIGHGGNNCVRASMQMINAYYGGTLTQDRITRWMIVENPDSNKKDLSPDFDLWHDSGSGNGMIPWTLGYTWNDWSKISNVSGRPSYTDVKTWLNAGRPLRVGIPGHSMVIDGWWDDNGVSRVHLLDPWEDVWDGNETHSGTGWRSYYGSTYLSVEGMTVCPVPADVPSPRVQSSMVTSDIDGDGLVCFDEVYRFGTSRYLADTDGDGIDDKTEIRSYHFDNNGNNNLLERIGNIWVCMENVTAGPCGYVYNPAATGVPWTSLSVGWICPRCGNSKAGFRNEITECMPSSPYDPNPDVMALIHANADPDGDGLRIELDPDSDNDGALDGEEDTNHNGKYEPDLGETDPFDASDRPYEGTVSATDDLLVADDILVAGNMIVDGDLSCAGNKAVIQTANYGRRLVFVEESATSSHFDRGQSRLSDGSVTIHLDPIFRETVTIDDAHPPVVRLTATTDCMGLYLSHWTPTSFTVKELGNGVSDATFNWELSARRRHYEDARLEELRFETEEQ